jgi:hypothetical protein
MSRPSAAAEAAERFNHSIKTLAAEMASIYRDDERVCRAHKRINLAVDVAPCDVIESVGPYLLKYGKEIYAMSVSGGGETFFLDKSFDAELSASRNREKVDLVGYLIPRVKEHVRGLSPAGREPYRAIVAALLDNYLDYTAATARQ